MGSPDWPTVSVVVLAYNRRDEVAVTLGKILAELEYPRDRLEILLVDNASTDGTADMVRERFPEVWVIRNAVNVGVSGWNVGLATSTGSWCLMLDDDCYVTGDGLRRAVRAAEEDAADLVSFRVVSSIEPGYFFNDEYRSGLFAFWGCAALISRRAVDELHGYDPKIFFWANEMELTMRLLDRGWRHLFLPEVVAVHMKPPTNPQKVFMMRGLKVNGRHWAYIAGKALRGGDAGAAFASHLWSTLYVAAFEDRRALKALLDIVAGFVEGVRSRDPVRPEVSRTYRRHCREMANPLHWARRPADIARGLVSGGDGEAVREDAIDRFFARRPRYYPTSRAFLEIPVSRDPQAASRP